MDARPGGRAYHRRTVPDHDAPEERALPIRLFLADVDGTLVTQDKVLTHAAVAAVRDLRQAGVLFAVTSGRPPRGMEMLVEPLNLDTPIAAFNGGLVVDRAMHVLEQHVIPEDLVVPVADHMKSFDLAVWLYRGADWYVPDPKGPHVDREAWTVKFEPKVMQGFDGLTDGVVKLVGVSDDHDAIEAAVHAALEKFGDHVTAAASQPYYLDVTSPDANKGSVARSLAARYELDPAEIATIGDQPNDILMFDHSGLSIAMGNADPEVKQAAHRTTQSNEDEGFAFAVEHFVLPAAAASPTSEQTASRGTDAKNA
jgi:Cof subfamily protein (haloacid dehalogenase superfamily)